MLKPVKRDNKKPYSSPIITVYGTVQELTQKVGLRGSGRRRTISALEDARLAAQELQTSVGSASQTPVALSLS